MTRGRLFFILIPAIVAMLATGTGLRAQGPGDLLVTPTRAVFESGKRFETLTLVNRGSDSATYRISVVQYRMTAEGSLERIDSADPGQRVATDLIRFFPREVVIAPGESQNVRVQIKMPEGLADGEYRSHLYFRAVPREQAAAADTMTKEFSVKLSAVYGVTVPVIVRQGTLNATVTVGDLSLTPGDSQKPPVVAMKFHREGTQSVCGTVRVTHVAADGTTTPLGSVGGVAVYTPNTDRIFRMPVTVPAGVDLHGGRLQVTFDAVSESSTQTLARGEMMLK